MSLYSTTSGPSEAPRVATRHASAARIRGRVGRRRPAPISDARIARRPAASRRIDSPPCPTTPNARRRRRRARCPACCRSSAPTAAASRWRCVFLVLAAVSTLAFPVALKSLIDQGLVGHRPGRARDGAARALPGAVRRGARRWACSRRRASTWSAGWASASPPTCATPSTPTCCEQSPEFFESTQTGEVLSRLTTDTTLVQTVVGSSLSMGLRNTVMGIGALIMLVVTNPWVMTQVLGILVLVVLPSLYFGRRVRQPQPRQPGPRGRLQRHRRRGAERHPGGAELRAGAARDGALRPQPPKTPSRPRASARGCARCWWPSSSPPPSARCCGACTRARRR